MSAPVLIAAAIVFLLLGDGFFSGSEIAIIAARRSRVEALIAEGRKGAARVKALQDNLDQFLATVQIGVTMMGTLAGVLGGILAAQYIEPYLRPLPVSHWLGPRAFGIRGVGPRTFVSEEEIKHLVREVLDLLLGHERSRRRS